jgi:Ran-binding protein 9/10
VLYYPTIGMKKPGETLRANFGQEPFHFDIDKMVADEKAAIQAEISRTTLANKVAADETKLIHQLIGQYLAHDGYVETARAFADETMEEARALANDDDADIPDGEAVEDLDALNRQSKVKNAPVRVYANLNRNSNRDTGRRHRQSAQAHYSVLPFSPPR